MNNLVIENSSDTVKVINGIYEFYVTKWAIDRVGLETLSSESMYTLNTQYYFTRYLHNELGPAFINRQTGEEHYYIKGECVTRQKIMFNAVKDEIDSILNED